MEIMEILNFAAQTATAAGLVFTAIQVRQGSRTSQGQFLLSLDQQLEAFDEIYYKIRSAHEHGSACMSFSDEEMLKVREYMGFLEIVEILIEGSSIREADFKSLFGHRIRALTKNDQIMAATVLKSPEKWTKFSKLVRRIEK